jgi:hypothetical protein
VVQGYSIWKHIFMKNLAREEKTMSGSSENTKWETALRMKK